MLAEKLPAAPDEDDIDDQLLSDVLRAALTRTDGGKWQVSTDDFWTRVTPDGYSFQEQGWKLHVSATPLSAPLVLGRCARVLLASRCAFKFARDLSHVRALVDARCPRGNGGKFITVYPADDDQFRAVAATLDEITQDLHGPRILSDRQFAPGSVVHYRYGIAAAQPVLTNDGSFESRLTAPDGTAFPDKRLAWFTPPPWAAAPFPGGSPAPLPATPGAVRLADRFVVRRAVLHANRGGVYVATDEHEDTEVIVKQARKHVGAALDGTDCRDELRHEAEMLGRFAPLGISPRKIALFEQQDSLFLAEELIPGTRLTTWVSERAGHGPATAAIAMAVRLADLLAAAHGTGLVLRDFNPNNLMVTPDGQIRLIDLECAVPPGARVARRHTPGFAAPEQALAPYFGPAPGQEADLYSLGATLFYLVTGAAPTFTGDAPARRDLAVRLAELISFMAADNLPLATLTPLVHGLMEELPGRRWSLARAREFLCAAAAGDAGAGRSRPSARSRQPDLAGLVDDGLAHLLRTMAPDQPRLWQAGDFGNGTDPCNLQYGAAGSMAVLVRAAQVAERAGLRDGIATAAGWIDERLHAIPRVLPGLYFGRSGTAWALHDAARYLGDARLASRAVELAERVTLAGWGNPDITHGTAGAGLARLHLWRASGRDDLRQRALECADAVLGAARARGKQTLWPIPAGFDSVLAGLEHYGFAHGVAGAGAFLLYAGLASGRDSYLTAALAAGRTLSQVAQVNGDSARWPAESGQGAERSLQHWCSGASGVGTFLIRLWSVTGDRHFLDLADAAAVTVLRQRWLVGNAACHGLAGDGEFLLDMAQLTGHDKYLDWALQVAAVIFARRFYLDGLAVAGGENPAEVTAAFNTGLAGVIGFLLRLLHQGPRMWMLDDLIDATGRGNDPRRP
ncbi:MAG: class IV lanthionine synthetase LanL [Streptosporangiaceae bacterium]